MSTKEQHEWARRWTTERIADPEMYVPTEVDISQCYLTLARWFAQYGRAVADLGPGPLGTETNADLERLLEKLGLGVPSACERCGGSGIEPLDLLDTRIRREPDGAPECPPACSECEGMGVPR